MISYKTLKKWRRVALNHQRFIALGGTSLSLDNIEKLVEIILKLTEELMDEHLLRK